MDIPSETVWGIFARALGLLYIIAFVPMIYQVLPLVGSTGLSPLGPELAAFRRDCGLLSRFWWRPTVLHLSHSDAMLLALPALGAACGALAFIGGPFSPLWFGLAWASLLSLDPAMGLAYPWDSFLLEMGFLAAWLPSLSYAWDSVTVSVAPTPLLAFTFHWLIFRVLSERTDACFCRFTCEWPNYPLSCAVGFGKIKFIGTKYDDRLYIKSFLLSQVRFASTGR